MQQSVHCSPSKKSASTYRFSHRRVQQKVQKIELRLTDRRRDADATHATVKRIAQDRERADFEMTALHEQEKQLEVAETNRQQLIADLRRGVAELEERTSNEPQHASAEVDAQLRTVKSEMRAAAEDMRDVEAQQTDLATEERQYRVRKEQAEQKLARLNNVRHQRMQILARGDKDTYDAIEWLASHRDIFQKNVYDPILVLLDVKQPQAARAVETCLNWNFQRTFVCQCRADYDLFTRELIDKRGWRLNVVELEGGRALSDYQPPIPAEELHRMGFDNYALDMVDAPEDVLRFLCHSAHFHLIPISVRGNAQPEQVERSGYFQRYIIGSTVFSTTVSKYGKRLPVTRSNDLKPLRNFAHSGQSEAREHAENELRLLAERFAALDERKQRLHATHAQHKDRYRDLVAQRDQLSEKQRDAQRVVAEWRKAQAILQAERQKLAREEARPPVAAQRRRIEEERRKVAVELGKLAERLLRTLTSMMEARADCDAMVLSSLHYTTQLNQCTDALRERQSALREAHHALEQVLVAFTQAKEETLACKRLYEQRMDECDDAMREAFREQYADDTESVDQLEMQLNSAQAALDIPWGVGPNVVEAFRQRKAKVAQLKETIEATRLEQTRFEAAIQRVENLWLPALETLIFNVNERFSAAFQRLGCAGEIRLARDEDYEKWGIDILVKFRDTEQLQLLTGQRQSGGVRIFAHPGTLSFDDSLSAEPDRAFALAFLTCGRN